MSKILNYGSLNIDYTYLVTNFVKSSETVAAKKLTVSCGGKGLNQSVAAAKAGAVVYHAGKVGIDGEQLKSFLQNSNVHTDFLMQGVNPSGHAIIQVDQKGNNCILTYSGSNHEISESEIDACLSQFEQGDYLMLQNEINAIPYILEKAFEQGLEIVFNPSPITEQLTTYPLDKVSIFVLNEIEGQCLSGETEPNAILTILHSKYPNAKIVLTLGEKGSIYFDGVEKVEQDIYKVKAIDTTAAGDTFTGYLIAALTEGKSPKAAMKSASIAAGIVVSKIGAAQSIPSLDEVEKVEGGKWFADQ